MLREFKKGRYYSSLDYRVVVDFPGHPGYESYYSKLEKVCLMRFEVSVMELWQWLKVGITWAWVDKMDRQVSALQPY